MTARMSSRQGLTALPDNLPWDQFDYAVVESAAEVRLLALPDQQVDAVKYPRGLAFGKLGELRWLLRANGKYHLVYVSEQGDVLPGATDDAGLDTGDDGQIILWGERDGDSDEFFDGRIPNPLPYPAGIPGQRLAVWIRNYTITEGEAGRTVFFFRCVGIRGSGGAL
jgi:hypothetical protein